MKHRLCILITVLFALIIPQGYAAEEKTTDYTEAVNMLTSLGIITNGIDDIYSPEDTVTRAEFATMLGKFLGVDDELNSSGGDLPFIDVNSDYWAAGSIASVYNLGIMGGMEHDYFGADESITFGQAIKALVSLTGYGVYAENNGGYPIGYLAVAAEKGISKGVMPTEEITKGEAAKLICNAAETDILQMSQLGKNIKWEEKDGQTLLSEKLKIKKIKGIVTANEETSLVGDTKVPSKNVRINGDMYKCGKTNAADFLGYYVTAYYRDNSDDNELVYVSINESGNSKIEINADDIADDTTVSSISYYNENENKKSVNIPENATVIFNGIKLIDYEKEAFMPATGGLVLLDADDDGTYETVFVTYYINYVVKNISADDDIIYIADKFDSPYLKIDTSKQDLKLIITKNNMEADISEIAEEDVISVKTDKIDTKKNEILSGSIRYEIIVSGETISGSVDAVDGENVKISGNNYEISPSYDTKKYPISLRDSIMAYLDVNGKVANIVYDVAEEYGFIINAGGKDALSDCEIKIFTSGGDIKIFKTAKKVKIDNKSYSECDDIKGALMNSSATFSGSTELSQSNTTRCEQLVRYQKNEADEIYYIDTIEPNSANKEEEKKHFSLAEKINLADYKDNVVYYMPSCRTIMSKIGVNDDVLVFKIPNDATDYNSYKIYTKDAITEEIKDSISAFDADDFNFAKVIMTSSASTEVPQKELKNMMLLKKVLPAYSNESNTYKLVGVSISTGAEMEIETKDDETIDKNMPIPGDIVRWTLTSDGKADIVERTYSPIEGEVINDTYPEDIGFHTNFRLTCGKVLNLSNDAIKLRYTCYKYLSGYKYDEASNMYLNDEIYLTKYLQQIFKYNRTTGKITKATLRDAKSAELYGEENASKIFAYQTYGMLTSLVIYED